MALTVTPNTGQNLNQTLNPIQTNFGTINAAFLVNHVEYGIAGQGKHKFVTMPEQGADPATAANEMAIYTKDVAAVTQLFLRNENNGSVINFTSRDLTLANGGTTLPSGIILKWGRGVTVANLLTVAFTAPFPTGILTAYAAVSSPLKAATFDFAINVYAYNVNNLSVVSQPTSPAQEFCWLAIGY